jgi:hypothetical protein
VAGENLTGVWQGLFSYPRMYRAAAFTASLIEAGNTLSGSATEIAVVGPRDGMAVSAFLSGRRTGSRVIFTKQYEGPQPPNHAVEYEGALSDDGMDRRALVHPGQLGRPLPDDPFGRPPGRDGARGLREGLERFQETC